MIGVSKMYNMPTSSNCFWKIAEIHRFLLFTEKCLQSINTSDWLDGDIWNDPSLLIGLNCESFVK